METKKKMGRPTDDPKVNTFRLRLTQKQSDDLQYCADKLGVTRTEVVNRGVQIIKSQLDK